MQCGVAALATPTACWQKRQEQCHHWGSSAVTILGLLNPFEVGYFEGESFDLGAEFGSAVDSRSAYFHQFCRTSINPQKKTSSKVATCKEAIAGA